MAQSVDGYLVVDEYFCSGSVVSHGEPVILAHPNWKQDFYVEADASATGITAVLSQLDKTGKLRLIQFLSSSLNLAHKNYSADQLEAWALVAATRKWSVNLKGGRNIVLLTDHCPLQWRRTGGGGERAIAPPPVTENIPRIYCTLTTMVYGVHYFDYYSIPGYMKPAIWEL